MVGPHAPLGVYVHWPYCARICPYCDFNVTRDRGQVGEQAALVEAILQDLASHRARLGERDLVSIFFGGGTPSLMRPDAVGEIIAACRRLWSSSGPVEISLEANPTDAEADRFAALAEAGVTRLSLGVQSLDDAALRFLGRNHGADEARRAAQLARRIFDQLSLDFIYALPGQTVADWRDMLRQAADLGPDHLSPYQLTIESGTAFERAVRRGRFTPAGDEIGADLYDATQETLTGLGFHAYEVSNHALGAEAEARHNLVYWRGEDYVGVGPGAHGRLRLGDGWTATIAHPGVEAYVRAVADTGTGWAETEPLSPIDRAQERLLMGLRLTEGVPWADLGALDLGPRVAAVGELAAEGFLAPGPDRLTATAAGRRLLDSIVRRLIHAPGVNGS